MTPQTEIPVAAKAAPARWRRFVRPAAIAAVLLLLAAGGYFGWRAWSGEGTANVAPLTALAQRGNLEDSVTATGTLQPKEFVDVGSDIDDGAVAVLHSGRRWCFGHWRPVSRSERTASMDLVYPRYALRT